MYANVRVFRSRNLLLAALAAAFVCLGGGIAHAQAPTIKKTPGPPAVASGTGYSVAAGSRMQWDIDTPLSPNPLNLEFIDEPQSAECENGGVSRYGTPGNAAENPAAQPWLTFPDTDGDGSCVEAVISLPAGAVAECDKLLERLIVRNITLPPFTPGQLSYLTDVDVNATPSARVCNWAHFTDPAQEPTDPTALRQSTADPNRTITSCTCVTITPPSGISFTGTKSAAPETIPLQVNDAASTVVYTITLTNTGTDAISGATFNDNLPAPSGLEWQDIVDCPAPLNCTIVSPTQLRVTGWDVPSTDPDSFQSMQVRAHTTCGAATDDDTGRACNQGSFSIGPASQNTDDPSTVAPLDATCVDVVYSNLTASTKSWGGDYVDANGNGQLDAGERVRFTISAKNTGRMGAKGVQIVDDLSASTCFDLATIQVEDTGTNVGGVITWDIGDLQRVVGTKDVHFSVVLLTDTVCCNQATVQSAERAACGLRPILTDDPSTPTNDDETCVSPGPQPNLQVSKDWCVEPPPGAGCPGTPVLTGQVRWTITIENTGAGSATAAQYLDDLGQNVCLGGFNGDVTVTGGGTNNSVPFTPPTNFGRVQVDDLGSADGTPGIQPGETVTLEFVTTVRNGVAGCCNQGQVSYAERPTAPVLTDDPVTAGRVGDPTCLDRPTPGPAGQLQKTVQVFDLNGDGFRIGEEYEFSLVFSNIGDVDLTNVVITDNAPTAPACMTFNTSSVTIEPPGAGTNASAGGNVIVNLTSPLAPAATVTIRFRATAAEIGVCCNQASWTSTQVPGPTLSDLDPADLVPDQPTCGPDVLPASGTNINMSIAKTSDAPVAGCADPGTTVNFTLTIQNTGTDPVSGWSLRDVLPAGFTNVVADAPLTAAGNTVTLAAGPNLTAGETRSYTYHAKVPCTGSGTLTNTAELTYNDGTANVTKNSATSVQFGGPNFSTSTKTLDSFDANSNGYNEAGEPVSYTITVVNSGTCAGRNVIVTDALDARFDGATVAFGPGSNGTRVGNNITWDQTTVPGLADVAPGATVTLTFTVSVVTTTTQDQRIPNTVVVDAPDMVTNCPGQSLRQQSAAGGANGGQVQWGQPVVGSVELLRNAMISCKFGALALLHTTVGGAPVMPPQSPRDVAASNPVSPYTATGDASTSSPPVNRVCPQVDLTNPANRDNRLVIYYMLSDGTVTDLKVHKQGNDCILTWTP